MAARKKTAKSAARRRFVLQRGMGPDGPVYTPVELPPGAQTIRAGGSGVTTTVDAPYAPGSPLVDEDHPLVQAHLKAGE